MNEQLALKILKALRDDRRTQWIDFTTTPDSVILDGEFTPEQLKAVAWWKENRPGEEPGVDVDVLKATEDDR